MRLSYDWLVSTYRYHKLPFIFLFIAYTVFLGAQIDGSKWYRITNLAVNGYSLEAGGPDGPLLAVTSNSEGQYWRFTHISGDYYHISSLYMGQGYAIDVLNNGNFNLAMACTAGFSGQNWTLVDIGNGEFQFRTLFTGADKQLTANPNDFNDLKMVATNGQSNQSWQIEVVGDISPNKIISPLQEFPNINLPESNTDFQAYPHALGMMKVIMLYVDFPDANNTQMTADVANHLLGNGAANALLEKQSFGKFSLDITQVNEWRRMSKNMSTYTDQNGLFSYQLHKDYITEVAGLFPEINFDNFDCVFIVPPQNPAIAVSPTWTQPLNEISSCVQVSNGTICKAITFGNDAYTNRYINLIHELGHVLGLPDLYPFQGANQVGPWALMSDIFKGTSFIGWHRHKMEWLDENRKTYQFADTVSYTLNRMDCQNGLSMIVVPESYYVNPYKVWVIELVEPVYSVGNDENSMLIGEGLLIYSVDARVNSGENPVKVYPKNDLNTDPGYTVGDTFDLMDAPMTVEVIGQVGTAYKVKVRMKEDLCPYISLVLEDDPTQNEVLQAKTTIESSVKINSPLDVGYIAGESVTLKTNFEVAGGALFSADINGCSN